MKKSILLLVYTLYSFFVLADEAPVTPVQSGNVKPIFQNDIAMKSEEILILLYPNYYTVEVNYVFENTGTAQKITMGFPNQTSTMFTQSISDFKAFEGANQLGVKTILAEQENKDPEVNFLPVSFYECSELYFEKGETKKVKNTYSQKYEGNYIGTIRKATYILKTGAFWKDSIGSIKATVLLKGISKNDLQKRTLTDIEGGKTIIDPLTFSPEFTSASDTIYTYFAQNVEPDFDLEISFPVALASSVSASSSLKTQGNYSYDAANVFDGNPNTGWAEGALNDGTGENLSFSFVLQLGGKLDATVSLNKIRIKNGLCASEKLFYENNRIKDLQLKFYDIKTGDWIYRETQLLDTMQWQDIEVSIPANTSSIEIIIISVYKGSKYNDTCISEISLVTE